jgi:hypothetical protein
MIQFVSLPSGTIEQIHLADMSHGTIKLLANLAGHRGPLPEPFHCFDFDSVTVNGYSYYSLHANSAMNALDTSGVVSVPLSACFVCADPAMASQAWTAAQEFYYAAVKGWMQLGFPSQNAAFVEEPKRAWIAQILYPTINFLGVGHRNFIREFNLSYGIGSIPLGTHDDFR